MAGVAILGGLKALGGLAGKGLGKLAGKAGAKAATGGQATSSDPVIQAAPAKKTVGQRVKGGYQNWIKQGQGKDGKQAAKPELDLSPKFSQRGVQGSMKKGGHVKKTGLYLLHKNEHVTPAKPKSSKRVSRKRVLVKL